MTNPKHRQRNFKIERNGQYTASCYCGYSMTDLSALRSLKAVDYHVISFRKYTTEELMAIKTKTELNYLDEGNSVWDQIKKFNSIAETSYG